MGTTRNGFILIMLLGFGLATLSALIGGWLDSQERPLEVDLRAPGEPRRRSGPPALRFAIAPVLSPERTASDYHDLTQYLAARLDRPVRLVQRKTYSEVNELLRHKAIHVAIICTGAYLHAQVDNIPLEIVAVPVYSDGPVYYSLLIVRTGSTMESIRDLQGHPFAFSDPLSLSGHYYPVSLLLNLGIDPHRFFSQETFTYSHDGSIKAVLDGIADGAAVDSLVYDFEALHNPLLTKKLRVIHRSPPLGINPVVVPAALELSVRESLRQAFLGMHETQAGQRILTSLRIARFDTPPATLYDFAAERFTLVRRYLEKAQ